MQWRCFPPHVIWNFPPVAVPRLSLSSTGKVVYTLKTPYRDGTTQVALDPLDFIARLAALVPKHRVNLTRYHGVLAHRLFSPGRNPIFHNSISQDAAENLPARTTACSRSGMDGYEWILHRRRQDFREIDQLFA